MAWVEILKSKDGLSDIAEEINKDVARLETITERFSKIGSMPKLKEENIFEILTTSVSYLKTRLSANINITLNNQSDNTNVPVNKMLFEWVIENVCKNAADAMQGVGKISINICDKNHYLCIEIQDSGKGLSKNHFKRIFEPGFTTKKRGWGLGLSLSKRIIENYHKGKLFVKSSEKEKGTILCILLHVN
jgi:nitrogen fixation/metabolism regulation signal transduction histidine kinase